MTRGKRSSSNSNSSTHHCVKIPSAEDEATLRQELPLHFRRVMVPALEDPIKMADRPLT